MEKGSKAMRQMVTELDSATECDLKIWVGEKDLLLDIKALISEYYIATILPTKR